MKTLLFKAIAALALGLSAQTYAQTLSESFEGDFPPAGWKILNYGSGTSWQQSTFNPQNGLESARISSGNHDDWFIAPKVSVTAATDSMHFWARKSSSFSSVSVDILGSTTGSDSASFVNVIDTNFSLTTTWAKYSYSLEDFVGQELYFGLHSINNSGTTFYVDNFTGPTLFVDPCPPVTDVDITDITSEGATFSWDPMAAAVTYNYNIFNVGEGPNGIAVASGSTTDTFAVVNNLPAISELEVWINHSCGAGVVSEISGPFGFETLCGTETEEYVEHFDAYIPQCWSEAKGEIAAPTTFTSTTSSLWIGDGFSNNGTTGAARVNIAFTSRRDWLISPTLDLDSIANSEISFFASLTDNGNSNVPDDGNLGDDDKVHVVISTDNGATWSSDNILMTFDTADVPSHLGEFYTVSLAAYTGQVKVAFYAESTVSNANTDFFIDHFTWGEATTCLPVSTILVDSVSSDDIYVSWENAGATTDVIIEYGENGFTLGSGTQMTVSGTSATISGLDPITEYDFYIQAVCAPGDSSVWSLVTSATTECEIVTEEYVQDFSSYVPDCWEEADGQIADTTIFSSTTISSWTADGFGNIGSTGAARMNIFSSSQYEWLISPSLDLDSIPNSEISFFAALTDFGNSGTPDNDNFGHDDKVHVVISTDNGGTWSDDNILLTFDTANVPSNTGDFYSVSLAAYSGVVKIGFYAESTVFNEDNDFFIDDFKWAEESNCVPVADITVDSVFAHDAYISWSNANTNDNFVIEYGEDGFTLGSGTQVTTTDTFYTITGLDALTDYDFYIRAVCAVGDSSIWSVSNAFSTECEELTSMYVQDFSSYVPECWEEAAGTIGTTTTFSSTTSSSWTSDGYLNNGTSGAARINIFGSFADEWLITPTLDLDSITNSQISFLAGLTDYANSGAPDNGNFGNDDKVNVVISTDNGATWSSDNILMTFDTANVPPHTGGYYTINLGAYSGSVKIGFYAESSQSNEDNDFFIDNFTWEETPSCLPIVTTTLDSIFESDAYFTIDNPNTTDNFILEYGEAGFTVGTGTIVTSVDTNIHISGLDPVTTYEVYITNVCAPGDTSVAVVPFTFTTECPIYVSTYTQDFASYIPTCWEEADGAIGTPTTFTSTTSSDWTADGFLNNGTSGAARVNISGSSKREWLITSSLNLDQISNSHIEFYAGLTDAFSTNPPDNGGFGDDDKVHVVISTDNGATWSSDNILMTFDTANTPSHLGQYYSISLAAYSGIVKIGFYAESTVSNESNDFSIDNFKWEQTPTCGQISIVNVDTTTSNSATLSWDNPNGAGVAFLIEYGTPGFTLGTGTQVISSNAGYEITGLDPTTTYEAYVTTVCAPGDTASWSGNVYFTTECEIATTYFTEDFASYVPNCWEEAEGTIGSPTTFSSTTSSSWTADGYLNSGTTGAARMNVFGSFANEWLISSTLDLDAQTYSQIEFDAGLTDFGNSNAPDNGSFGPDDRVMVVISLDNGATWSEANTLMTFDQSNTPSHLGQHYAIPLINYSGQVKIGFYAESTQSNEDNDFFIDNFQWSEAPTCLPTSVYDLDDATDTTATVTWTNVNGVSDYILEYGTPGFILGTGTTLTVTDTFVNFENLLPNTAYQVYVKAVCSATDTALYSTGYTFSTECTLLDDGDVEDFATYLPECWSEAKGQLALNTTFTSASSSWTQDGYLNVGSSGAARINIFGTLRREWLISPSINLDSSPKQIEFDAGMTDFSGTGPDNFGADDKFVVVISTDNGITWSDTNVLMTFDATNPLPNAGDHYVISLQDYSGEVKIGFYAESTVSNTDYNAYVDNFEVKDKDITSNDLSPFGATVNATSCIGASNQLFITLESTGLNPADSFYLDVNITGNTNYDNGNVFYTQHLALGTYTPILITDVGTFAIGTYTGQAIVSNVYDTDVTNDTLEFTFEVVDLPTVNAGNDVTICNGDEYQLDASGAATYTWSGGLSNGDFVSPTTTTEYVVTGVSAAGCENTDTITVHVISGLSPAIIEFNGYLASASNFDTYTWTFNGAVIGTTSQVEPTENGVYTLTVTNGTGCSASVDYTVTGIGLEDIEQTGLTVYPNPTTGILNISGGKTITNLQIIDVRGREVYRLDELTESTLDLTELSEGYYILKGEVEGQVFQTKFTKQ